MKLTIPKLSNEARCRRNIAMALFGAMAQLLAVVTRDMHMFFAVAFGLFSGWFIMWAVHEIECLIELHQIEMLRDLADRLREKVE